MRIEFDAEAHLVRGPGGEARLSRAEAAVLSVLARRPGRPFSRDKLLDAIYGDRPESVAGKTIDVLVCRIRRKLYALGADDVVTTIRGAGWVLNSGSVAETVAMTADQRAALRDLLQHARRHHPTLAARLEGVA